MPKLTLVNTESQHIIGLLLWSCKRPVKKRQPPPSECQWNKMALQACTKNKFLNPDSRQLHLIDCYFSQGIFITEMLWKWIHNTFEQECLTSMYINLMCCKVVRHTNTHIQMDRLNAIHLFVTMLLYPHLAYWWRDNNADENISLCFVR